MYSSSPTENSATIEDWYWEGMQGDDTDKILTEEVTGDFTKLIQKNLTARKYYTVGESFIAGFEKLLSMGLTDIKINYLSSIGWVTLLLLIGLCIPVLGKESQESDAQSKSIPCGEKDEKILEDTCAFCGGAYVHGLHTSCPHCGASIKPMSDVSST